MKDLLENEFEPDSRPSSSKDDTSSDLATVDFVTIPPECDVPADDRVIPPVEALERELVLQARDGNLEAFAALLARYRNPFLRYGTNMLGSREDAEEVVQDVFVRAHRSLDRCDPDRFGAWVYRILVNRVRSAAVKRRWWRRRADSLDAASQIGVPHPASRSAWREELDRAIAMLPAEQREAFLLKYVEDMKYDEMTDLTGASISALKMRVARACERLRAILGESA